MAKSKTKSNVIAMPGYSIPTAKGVPVKSVVDILSGYLKMAKAGHVRGVAIACVVQTAPDQVIINNDFAAEAGKAWDLYAGLGRLNRRFDDWIDR